METARPEVTYRQREDMLILRFGPAVPAVTVELGDGMLVRVDPKTEEIVGIEVLNLSKRVRGAATAVSPSGGPCPNRPDRETPRMVPRGLVPG